MTVSLVPAFQALEMRSPRAAFFSGFGASDVVTSVHKLLLYGGGARVPTCRDLLASAE